jgi:hypothetical protein
MIKKICIKLIEFYQKSISPWLGHRCKYYPSCSEYTKQAIEKYGAVRGTIKGIKRILRCNPFSKGGYDPLK